MTAPSPIPPSPPAGGARHVAFPFRVDGRGRTAEATDAAYVRGLIEQVLFTAPGERVNRPSFGSGVAQLVFAPAGDALAAAAELSIQSALQLWLGDLLEVRRVSVAADEGRLTIVVEYVLRRTQETLEARFTRPAG